MSLLHRVRKTFSLFLIVVAVASACGALFVNKSANAYRMVPCGNGKDEKECIAPTSQINGIARVLVKELEFCLRYNKDQDASDEETIDTQANNYPISKGGIGEMLGDDYEVYGTVLTGQKKHYQDSAECYKYRDDNDAGIIKHTFDVLDIYFYGGKEASGTTWNKILNDYGGAGGFYATFVYYDQEKKIDDKTLAAVLEGTSIIDLDDIDIQVSASKTKKLYDEVFNKYYGLSYNTLFGVQSTGAWSSMYERQAQFYWQIKAGIQEHFTLKCDVDPSQIISVFYNVDMQNGVIQECEITKKANSGYGEGTDFYAQDWCANLHAESNCDRSIDTTDASTKKTLKSYATQALAELIREYTPINKNKCTEAWEGYKKDRLNNYPDLSAEIEKLFGGYTVDDYFKTSQYNIDGKMYEPKPYGTCLAYDLTAGIINDKLEELQGELDKKKIEKEWNEQCRQQYSKIRASLYTGLRENGFVGDTNNPHPSDDQKTMYDYFTATFPFKYTDLKVNYQISKKVSDLQTGNMKISTYNVNDGTEVDEYSETKDTTRAKMYILYDIETEAVLKEAECYWHELALMFSEKVLAKGEEIFGGEITLVEVDDPSGDGSTTIVHVVPPEPPEDPGDGFQDIDDDPTGSLYTKDTCYDNSGSLGWILCPLISAASGIGTHMWEQIEQHHMKLPSAALFGVSAGQDEPGVRIGWRQIRDIANILFVVVFLIIILSQITGLGLKNYDIKKMLPKLIVAIVLVNLSYYACQLAVDLSNTIGVGLNRLFENIASNIPWDLGEYGSYTSTGDSGGFITGALLVGAAGGLFAIFISMREGQGVGAMVAGLGPLVLSMVIVIVVAMATLYLTLMIREAAIVIGIVVAPVAIMCNILPNTQPLFKKWLNLMKALLVLYPVCSFVVGGGKLAGAVLASTGLNSMRLAASIVQVVPYFFIPTLLRRSLNGLGGIGSRLHGLGRNFGHRLSSGATNGIRKLDGYKRIMDESRWKAQDRRARRITNGIGIGRHRIGGLQRRKDAGKELKGFQDKRLDDANNTLDTHAHGLKDAESRNQTGRREARNLQKDTEREKADEALMGSYGGLMLGKDGKLQGTPGSEEARKRAQKYVEGLKASGRVQTENSVMEARAFNNLDFLNAQREKLKAGRKENVLNTMLYGDRDYVKAEAAKNRLDRENKVKDTKQYNDSSYYRAEGNRRDASREENYKNTMLYGDKNYVRAEGLKNDLAREEKVADTMLYGKSDYRKGERTKREIARNMSKEEIEAYADGKFAKAAETQARIELDAKLKSINMFGETNFAKGEEAKRELARQNTKAETEAYASVDFQNAQSLKQQTELKERLDKIKNTYGGMEYSEEGVLNGVYNAANAAKYAEGVLAGAAVSSDKEVRDKILHAEHADIIHEAARFQDDLDRKTKLEKTEAIVQDITAPDGTLLSSKDAVQQKLERNSELEIAQYYGQMNAEPTYSPDRVEAVAEAKRRAEAKFSADEERARNEQILGKMTQIALTGKNGILQHILGWEVDTDGKPKPKPGYQEMASGDYESELLASQRAVAGQGGLEDTYQDFAENRIRDLNAAIKAAKGAGDTVSEKKLRILRGKFLAECEKSDLKDLASYGKMYNGEFDRDDIPTPKEYLTGVKKVLDAAGNVLSYEVLPEKDTVMKYESGKAEGERYLTKDDIAQRAKLTRIKKATGADGKPVPEKVITLTTFIQEISKNAKLAPDIANNLITIFENDGVKDIEQFDISSKHLEKIPPAIIKKLSAAGAVTSEKMRKAFVSMPPEDWGRLSDNQQNELINAFGPKEGV